MNNSNSFNNQRAMAAESINPQPQGPNDTNMPYYNYGNFPPYMNQNSQNQNQGHPMSHSHSHNSGHHHSHSHSGHHSGNHPHHTPRRMSVHGTAMPNMVAPFTNGIKNDNMFDLPSPHEGDFPPPNASLVGPIAINRHRPHRYDSWDDNQMFGLKGHPMNSSPHGNALNMISPISEDFNYDSVENDQNLSASFGAHGPHHHQNPLSNPRMMNHNRHPNSFNENMNNFSNMTVSNGQGPMQMYSMSLPNQNSGWNNHMSPGSLISPNNVTRSARGSVVLDPEHASKQDLILMEKRRRRRESHNQVERRRRDIINEKIQELSTLLPDSLLDNTKVNKGAILRKSVDYIRHLQSLLNISSDKNSLNSSLSLDNQNQVQQMQNTMDMFANGSFFGKDSNPMETILEDVTTNEQPANNLNQQPQSL